MTETEPYVATGLKRVERHIDFQSHSPQMFLRLLRQNRIERAYLVVRDGTITVSHPEVLGPLADFVARSQDMAGHEAVFLGQEERIDSLFVAVIHSTKRGLGQGGLRFWGYDQIGDVFTDGLRLAQGMTRKNAMAGLWWGGAKGIATLPPGISRPEELVARSARDALFRAYGRFVSSLGGVYYTAEDVGTTTEDMSAIFQSTRFATCIPRHLGGSGDPSPHTAQGVLRAVESARQFLTGSRDLSGVRIAVQGLGNVGAALSRKLHAAGAKLWVTDLRGSRVESLAEELPGVVPVQPDSIYDLDVDVFAPCGCGAVLNRSTVPRLKASLVCGAANNVLAEAADAGRLSMRGIAYVPDFVCNRMGIVNCADEWAGYLEEDVRAAAERVADEVLALFEYSRRTGLSTSDAANLIADAAAVEPHPWLGRRGARLIDHLVNSGWAQSRIGDR